LEAADLVTLALTSHKLQKLATCDQLWIEKISADFGSRDTVIDILDDAGIDIAEMVAQSTEIAAWKLQSMAEQDTNSNSSDMETDEELPLFSYTGDGLRCYKARYTKVFPASDNDLVSSTKRAEAVIDETKQMLRAGPDAGIEVFAEAALRLMVVQDSFPNSAECYYLWALICFMLNSFKPSLRFLEIGQAINPEFSPIKELAAEVRSIVDGAYGNEGDAPLLNASGSGPSAQLAKALAIIFQRLDLDRDGVLNASELGKMVKITNGQMPPAAMISQIIHAFGGQIQSKGGRKVTGWDISSLTNFYIAQTLDDPKETRNDLAKFGFDPQTLKATL
ncbi:hypothetical protein LPJ56_005598, partial [Coemansia sp. RSA 2599]